MNLHSIETQSTYDGLLRLLPSELAIEYKNQGLSLEQLKEKCVDAGLLVVPKATEAEQFIGLVTAPPPPTPGLIAALARAAEVQGVSVHEIPVLVEGPIEKVESSKPAPAPRAKTK